MRACGRACACVLNIFCVDSRGHSFHPIFMKFGQNVYFDEIWVEIVFGSSGVKTRPLGQIIEKPCVDNRGHSFHPIFMKFGQNVHLDKIWVGIVFGSSGVKN